MRVLICSEVAQRMLIVSKETRRTFERLMMNKDLDRMKNFMRNPRINEYAGCISGDIPKENPMIYVTYVTSEFYEYVYVECFDT